MTDRKQLQEDFSYIRRALERQRRFVHDYVPVWFAALIGLFVLGIMATKDLTAMGYLAAGGRDWFVKIGAALLIAVLLVLHFRRHGKSNGQGQYDSQYLKSIIGPWIIFAATIVMLRYAGETLGLDKAMWRPITFIYIGSAFTLIGFDRLNVTLWFGLGVLAGTAIFIFTPFPLPYTALGVTMALGVIFGAWLDHRAAQRLGANG